MNMRLLKLAVLAIACTLPAPALFAQQSVIIRGQNAAQVGVYDVLRSNGSGSLNVNITGGTGSATGGITDAELRASPVPVTGGLTDTQLRATPVPISGTVTATTGASTATLTQTTPTVTSSAANLLAANASRKSLIIQNNNASAGIVYVNFGATATTAHFQIQPGQSLFMNSNVPVGTVSAIGSIASNANVSVIEGQ